ncbi:MAG TPA: ABC transporter permease [Candidatus Sulfotelmatobacter sp.]|nr:ABC transporter permease [Candidatus Sulfotelmatobacter sp.]
MNSLLQDFRYAVRQIRKSPAFMAFAVITLALGIGANTAILSIVDASVLHPLPFPHASGIMTLYWTDSRPGGLTGLATVTDPGTVEWRKQNSLLQQIAFYRGHTANLTGVGDPVRLVGAEVSASLFPLLETTPLLGRTFLTEEETLARNHVVLLSHKLWQSRFAANPDAIGRSIRLDGQFFTVAGVMPPSFDFPSEAEFWTPLAVTADDSNATLKVLARLKPGVSLKQAQAETVVIARRLDEQHHRNPDSHVKTSLIPLETAIGADSRLPMFTLLGAVGLLLLIACANVANLLLARAASRSQEMAIRNALGATRWRIIRQLVTESALFTALGASLGLLLAYIGRGALVSATLAALPKNLASPGAAARIAAASIDHSVLMFTLIVSLFTGILFGLAPVLQGSGSRPNCALKAGTQNAIGSLGKGRLREILVVSEIALAFVLLSGAGLLLRSFVKLMAIHPGFEPRNVLSMNLELPESRYQTPAQMIAFEQQSLERLQAIPGVISAGSVFGLPLGDMLIRGDFVVESQPAPPPDASPAKILVGGDYFNAIGIPLLAGRTFNLHDSPTAPPVVVISQSLARRFWPNQDPIGRRLKLGFSHDPWCTVIGVVGDVRQFDLQDESALALYIPYAQAPIPFLMQSLALVVRYRSDDPSATASAARHAIAAVDPDLPLFDISSMEQLVYRSLSEPRFNTFLLGLFAALALLLAALGTYGVMSCVVTARTREIGVRIALGASQQDVLRQILARVMMLAAIGLSAGLLGSALVSRFLENQLYHVQPSDIGTYVVVSILMLFAALLAGYLPARRASKVDPMVALRYE